MFSATVHLREAPRRLRCGSRRAPGKSDVQRRGNDANWITAACLGVYACGFATSTASALLIGADDEVAFAHLGARDAQILGRVELVQDQCIAVPADELLDQHSIAFLVDDDVAAA